MQIQLQCLSHSPLRGWYDPEQSIVEEVNLIHQQAKLAVEKFDPELIIIFAPDHYNGLFYDLMPPFVLATEAESVGDFRTLTGKLSVDQNLAKELGAHILNNDVDIAISHRLQVDHGCTLSLEDLTGSLTRYPVIPIIINAVAPPFAPYRRIRKLGEAVGSFIKQLNKRVLIVGTGGLSHEPPVPVLNQAPAETAEFLIAGRNPTAEQRAAREQRTLAAGKIFGTPASPQTPLNPEWDQAFIDLLISGQLEAVDQFEVDVISRLAGRSTHEVRTWVAAFSALSAAAGKYTATLQYYRPINEWIAGYSLLSAKPQGNASSD